MATALNATDSRYVYKLSDQFRPTDRWHFGDKKCVFECDCEEDSDSNKEIEITKRFERLMNNEAIDVVSWYHLWASWL